MYNKQCFGPTTLLQWKCKTTNMLLAACVAPVVAPRLFKGAYGTLRERAVAGHLPLDRQGRRKSAHNYNNSFVHHTTKTRNWRVSVDNDFLHVITKIVSGGTSETRPVSKACQRFTSVIDSKFLVRSGECEQRILAAS